MAMIAAKDMARVHEILAAKIDEVNKKTRTRVNKHRETGPQLKKGDKVYLLTKNLRTQKPSKKLDHIKVGPFLIKEVKGPVNYELELPKDARVHPVFHISLLEPADAGTPLQTNFRYAQGDQDEYEVERI